MKKINNHFFKDLILFLFILFLPTQFGKHFFLDFSYVSGVKVDYLSIIFYLTDILAFTLMLLNWRMLTSWILKQKKVLQFFLALAFLNIAVSPVPQIGFYSLLKIIEFIFIYIIFRSTKIESTLLVLAFTIDAVVELILAVAQLYTKGALQGIFYFLGERSFNISSPGIAKASFAGVEFLRPYGTFSHPNSMAGFYLLLFFFALTTLSSRWSYVLLVVSSLLVIVSFSKTAIVVFVVLHLLFFLKQKKTLCTLCFLSRIVTFMALLLFLPHLQTDPLTLEKRLYLLKNSFGIIENHLLFGTGLGQYLYAQAAVANPYPYFFLQPVHNIFILFLAQSGILLTGFTVWVLYLSFRRLFTSKSFLFCAAVVILTGLFDHYWLTLQQNWLLLGVVFGILKREV